MATQHSGQFAAGARVTVRDDAAHHHVGRTGTVVSSRNTVGIIVYAVRLDRATETTGKSAPVEMFASELTASADIAVRDAVAATNLAPFLDRAWEDHEFADLLHAPVDALQGVSADDAALLRSALGIRTIHDLAANRFVVAAQSITKFADAGTRR